MNNKARPQGEDFIRIRLNHEVHPFLEEHLRATVSRKNWATAIVNLASVGLAVSRVPGAIPERAVQTGGAQPAGNAIPAQADAGSNVTRAEGESTGYGTAESGDAPAQILDKADMDDLSAIFSAQ